MVDDFSTQLKNNQKCAYCNGCGAYIKNIPYSEPKFFFGKYKGELISSITDLGYLEWFLANVKLNPYTREAIQNQISALKGGKNG